jgi:hypothetical protein
MKARARKAALGGIENLQPAVGLPLLDTGATHLVSPHTRIVQCRK